MEEEEEGGGEERWREAGRGSGEERGVGRMKIFFTTWQGNFADRYARQHKKESG